MLPHKKECISSALYSNRHLTEREKKLFTDKLQHVVNIKHIKNCKNKHKEESWLLCAFENAQHLNFPEHAH